MLDNDTYVQTYVYINIFQLNIFTCALTGSYACVIMLDFYMNSGLHYIVLNSLRHGTDKSFVEVHVTGPFSTHGE